MLQINGQSTEGRQPDFEIQAIVEGVTKVERYNFWSYSGGKMFTEVCDDLLHRRGKMGR